MMYACMYAWIFQAAQVFVYCEGHVRGIAIAARHNSTSLIMSGFSVQGKRHAALKLRLSMWDWESLLP